MLGLNFSVKVAEIQEIVPPGSSPEQAVMSLASQKARAVRKNLEFPQNIIVGADTVVSYQGKIFGKPKSQQEAVSMLSLLSGATHQVFTGVCILTPSSEEVFYEKTDVTFFPLTQREICRYVSEENPMDKAGAYGIQGKAAAFVEKIEGDFFNVVGFPAARFLRKMKQFWGGDWD